MLLVLFYTQLGYYGQFMILQWQMKEAAREAWLATVPDARLYRISLADVDASGRWEEEGRECWFRDHLYDVIRREKIAGKIYVFCLDDEREAQLIRQSGEVTRANLDHPGKKDTHPSLLKTGDMLPAEDTGHSIFTIAVRQYDLPLSKISSPSAMRTSPFPRPGSDPPSFRYFYPVH